MDTVFIEQLSAITTIGVYQWEQTIKQKLFLDIELAWDNQKAAKSDNVADCLNYAEVTEAVLAHVENNKFALVERVAEEVAELLLTTFATSRVSIRVTKPSAVAQAKAVGVKIVRGVMPS